MIRQYKIGFLGAGLFAVLVACHPAKPAQSVGSPGTPVQCPDASTGPARASREVVGFAPAGAPRTPCTVENHAKPAAPLPNADDPIWRLDMP